MATRNVLEDGLRNGRGARSMALDLIGRVARSGPLKGKRVGGIVGLDSEMADDLINARAILSDPDRLREYFVVDRETGKLKPRYKLSDRRYLGRVAKAVREGRGLSVTDIEQIMTGHKNKALLHRGDRIARTETIGALNAGRVEGIKQLVDSGAVSADQVTMIWNATPGRRTRDTHAAMNGQKSAIDGIFTSPSGARMRHPGDTSLGAPASEVVNCRCYLSPKIDFLAGVT